MSFQGCFSHDPLCTLTRDGVKPHVYRERALGANPVTGHFTCMVNRISHFRKKAGISQEALGQALNSGRSTITKLERSEIPLNENWLARLSIVLKCTPTDLLGEFVPIVGKIGAGGSIVYEDIGSSDMVQRPPKTIGELVGLEVVGESMLPKFDPGDIVYISRSEDGVDANDIGSICACRLVTGETYLKQVLRSQEPGKFTLRSYNAADMESCELLWATPIRAITPRQARRFHS